MLNALQNTSTGEGDTMRRRLKLTVSILLTICFCCTAAGILQAEEGSVNNLLAQQRAVKVLKLPDLVIHDIVFEKKIKRVDEKGIPYWIFNVFVKVENRGAKAAGKFYVLLERNAGPGGTWIKACPTFCVMEVNFLGAGQIKTLPGRQFNNSAQKNPRFRATADSTHVIAEGSGREGNNQREENFLQISKQPMRRQTN